MKNDLLGIQPSFLSGNREPNLASLANVGMLGDLRKRLRAIWIDHPPQLVNIQRILAYRQETLGQFGKPFDGRSLCQLTQAGKSAIAWRIKAFLAEQRALEGLEANEFQVIIVTVKKGMTIKGFLQAVLHKLGDEFLDEREGRSRSTDRRSIQLLEQRIAEWVPKLGVELLFVEEVQRLVGARIDAKQVTEQFQTMLDGGVVPLVLTGTEEAADLFASNKELRARLGTPLELLPVPGTDDATAEMLQNFCEEFDRELTETGIFQVRSGLDEPEIVLPISKVTGGHIGRVSRLLKEATMSAVERGATFLEPFDLSNATRRYAIPNDWVDEDPFSRKAS